MNTSAKKCPQCGSGAVSLSVTRMDRKTGKPLGKGKLILAYILLVVGVIWAITLLALVFSVGVATGEGEILIAVIPLGLLVAVMLFFGIRMVKSYYGASQVRDGECLNCRHRWSEVTGNVGIKAPGKFCPQCGKEEVFVSTYKADIATHKPVSALWGWIGLPVGIILVVGAIFMAINVWQEGDGGIIRWQYGSTIAGLGFLGVGLWLGGTLIGGGVGYFRARNKTDMRCAGCGHSWSQWADGTPIEAPRTILDADKAQKPPENEPK